ncbi:MAG: BON domain-containing protein [Planctomycetaceae bacterium]|nr:BON domain-containing protein [Planctomycetaceae bacterium]
MLTILDGRSAITEPTLKERVGALIESRAGLRRGQIEIGEDEGGIVLSGVVRRYYDRQVALKCAQHVIGVRRVVDRITVQDSAATDSGHWRRASRSGE